MIDPSEIRWNGLPGLAYRAFLLRCWQEAPAGSDGGPVWRFALVRAGDQQTQRAFASLEDLMGFLREELVAAGQPDQAAGR